MYKRWFSDIEEFTEELWEKSVKDYNLIGFDYSIFDKDSYGNLITTLDSIDTSDERKEYEKTISSIRPKKRTYEEILSYFDLEVFSLKHMTNITEISKRSGFAFKVVEKSKELNEPKYFECKTYLNDEEITIYYSYLNNEMSVNNSSIGKYSSVDELPSIIKKFVRSFYRYLKYSQNILYVNWII